MNSPLRYRPTQSGFFFALLMTVTAGTGFLLPAVCTLLFGGSVTLDARSAPDGFDAKANGAIRSATNAPFTFENTGSLHAARASQTATLLHNGKVLVTGGYNGSSLTSAELYDPASGSWTVTGSLNTGRDGHTATLLSNGKVLVTGGLVTTAFSPAPNSTTRDAGLGL